MKPFNLEAALNGKPVITREGDKVIQLAYFPTVIGDTLFVQLGKRVYRYDKYGAFLRDHISPYDLFMATTKREGWINVYKDKADGFERGFIYNSPDEAERAGFTNDTYAHIVTIHIEWEE